MRKLGFIDIGARGGFSERLAPYLDRLDLVLVEPEPIEARRLVAESENGSRYQVIPSALAHIDGEVPFYRTFNPWCSSCLRSNDEFFKFYEHAIQFAVEEESQIGCHRFDTLHSRGGLPYPDLVKIDVQGFEYQVLQGFGGLLQNCLAIELEAHFYQVYRGQKLLGDIVEFLRSYDFVLKKLSNSRTEKLSGDPVFDSNLIEVDATFTKNKQWTADASRDDVESLQLALQIFGVQ